VKNGNKSIFEAMTIPSQFFRGPLATILYNLPIYKFENWFMRVVEDRSSV